jgi:hypothetical protein
MRARPTTPPTTPPAIAPTLVELPPGDGGVDSVAVGDDVEAEAAGVLDGDVVSPPAIGRVVEASVDEGRVDVSAICVSRCRAETKTAEALTWLTRFGLVEGNTGERRLVTPVPAPFRRCRQARPENMVAAKKGAR